MSQFGPLQRGGLYYKKTPIWLKHLRIQLEVTAAQQKMKKVEHPAG